MQGYRLLPNKADHFVDGTITGFGQAILVSAFLQEIDLKNGNIGVDENNRVIKIDGDQCLASVLGVKETFDLTPKVIAELPYPHDFYASHWLDLIRYKDKNTGLYDTLFRSGIVPNERDSMKNSNLFRAEVNQAMLKICLLPDEYIEKFVATYMLPDGQEYVKNIKWKGKIGGIEERNYVDFIKHRRDVLMESALKNESFINYLLGSEAQEDAISFIEHIRDFRAGGEPILSESQAVTESINSVIKDLKTGATLASLTQLGLNLDSLSIALRQQEEIDTKLLSLGGKVDLLLNNIEQLEVVDQYTKSELELNTIYNSYVQLKKQQILPLSEPSYIDLFQSDQTRRRSNEVVFKIFLKESVTPVLGKCIVALQKNNLEQLEQLLKEFPKKIDWPDNINIPEAAVAKERMNMIKRIVENKVIIEAKILPVLEQSRGFLETKDLSSAQRIINTLPSDEIINSMIINGDLKEQIIETKKELLVNIAELIQENKTKNDQVSLLVEITKQVTALEKNYQLDLTQLEVHLNALDHCLKAIEILKAQINEPSNKHKVPAISDLHDLESRLKKIAENLSTKAEITSLHVDEKLAINPSTLRADPKEELDTTLAETKYSEIKFEPKNKASFPDNIQKEGADILENKPTLPNEVKVRINIMRIPRNEREENILAVYSVLNNNDLIRNQDGSIPNIIKEIQDIVGKLDPSKEEEIANAILVIKGKIIHSGESGSTENVSDIINAFSKPGCCDFKKIRAELAENPSMNDIMNPIRWNISGNN
ncbi:SidE phosphodiesterase domain-containing protein [Legionella sainthelensi]|uniref:SidE phosphodiesterase domain-containing protein n=1 Tax=Legionella sainthelensi TaxID=28087 RepID=UPI0013EEB72A|nr:SidE phosphodiesterase domain-containing protein [Legionella sainthelensi]